MVRIPEVLLSAPRDPEELPLDVVAVADEADLDELLGAVAEYLVAAWLAQRPHDPPLLPPHDERC